MMLPEVKEIVQIPVVQLNATGDRLDGASPKGRHGNPKYFENGPKWARNGAEDPRKILEKGVQKGPVFDEDRALERGCQRCQP